MKLFARTIICLCTVPICLSVKPMPNDGFYKKLETIYTNNDNNELKDILKIHKYEDYYTDYEDMMITAISHGSVNIVNYIFDNKMISEHYHDYNMNTYLLHACHLNNINIVNRTLREMINVEQCLPKRKYMKDILITTVKNNRREIIESLFQTDEMKQQYGYDLLHTATEYNNKKIFDMALLFASVNEKLKTGKSPITYAASNGNLDMVNEFLKFPEIIQYCCTYGENNVLADAAKNGNIEIVNKLLEHDCIKLNANARFNKAANYAMTEGHWDVFKRLYQEEKVKNSIDCLNNNDKNYIFAKNIMLHIEQAN